MRPVRSKSSKRAESIEAFEGAGRRELAERERAEREAIAAYAPEPLSEAELDALARIELPLHVSLRSFASVGDNGVRQRDVEVMGPRFAVELPRDAV